MFVTKNKQKIRKKYIKKITNQEQIKSKAKEGRMETGVAATATGQAASGQQQQQGESCLLLSLPYELLSSILLEIPTDKLYPSCFLVCKQLLATLLDGVAWQARCERDLHITERLYHSWYLTYKGKAIFIVQYRPTPCNIVQS